MISPRGGLLNNRGLDCRSEIDVQRLFNENANDAERGSP